MSLFRVVTGLPRMLRKRTRSLLLRGHRISVRYVVSIPANPESRDGEDTPKNRRSNWQAKIFWVTDDECALCEGEVIIGPLGSLAYYIRKHVAWIRQVELTPFNG